MTAAVATVNLILGLAYTGYGVMTAIEMKRDWKTLGFSHFGAAWIFMAFTCGPHHLAHGLHTAIEGRVGGPLDLYAVAIGLPVGVIWLYLRIEAFAGGRGDRSIQGTPLWLGAAPTIAAVYVTTIAFGIVTVGQGAFRFASTVMPNLLLFAIYCAIGYFLLRTQLADRAHEGGWSVSGLSLSVVFPTCALMHIVWATYSMTGQYAFDIHGFVIDWAGVPAGAYFLWVVHALYRGTLHDWNDARPASAITELGSTPRMVG